MSPYLTSFERVCDRLREIFTLPWVALSILLILAVAGTLPTSPADPDLFARVALGRLVEATSSVPTVDPFSFSPKLPLWIDHEWLSGVVFWNVVSLFGDVGLVTLKVLLVCATAALIVAAARIASPGSNPSLFFLVLCLSQGIYSWGSTIRCQTFTYLFLAYQLLALVAHRERHILRYLIPIPLLTIAWVNLHGGYALGMTFLWLWTLLSFVEGRRSWFLVAMCVLASAAPFFTPYGFLTYSRCLIEALTMKRPTISEWAPLWHHPLLFAGITAVIAPLAVGVTLTRDTRRNILPLGVMAYSIYCGVSHLRFVTATVIVCAIFGGPYFRSFLTETRDRFPLRLARLERVMALATIGVVAFCVVTIMRVSTRASTYKLDFTAYPVAAIQWLREQKIEGRLLVDFNNGSFALWRLYPFITVSMDGRYEAVYAPETAQLNTDALQLGTPQSDRALDILKPTHALIHLASPNQVFTPRILSSWKVIYRDERYAIFSRIDTPARSVTQEERVSSDMWRPLF